MAILWLYTACFLAAAAPVQADLEFLTGEFTYKGWDYLARTEVKGEASGGWQLERNWLLVIYTGYWNDHNYLHFNAETERIEHIFFGAEGSAVMRVWKVDEEGVLNGSWQAGQWSFTQVIGPTEEGYSVMRWRAKGDGEKHLVLQLEFARTEKKPDESSPGF